MYEGTRGLTYCQTNFIKKQRPRDIEGLLEWWVWDLDSGWFTPEPKHFPECNTALTVGVWSSSRLNTSGLFVLIRWVFLEDTSWLWELIFLKIEVFSIQPYTNDSFEVWKLCYNFMAQSLSYLNNYKSQAFLFGVRVLLGRVLSCPSLGICWYLLIYLGVYVLLLGKEGGLPLWLSC